MVQENWHRSLMLPHVQEDERRNISRAGWQLEDAVVLDDKIFVTRSLILQQATGALEPCVFARSFLLTFAGLHLDNRQQKCVR